MITLFLTILLAAPQDEGQEPPVYQLEDLSISSYQPQYVDADSLYNLVSDLLERNLLVDHRSVSNLNFIYDRILIYDTPESTKRIQAMMRQIDEGFQGSVASMMAPEPPPAPKLTDFPVQEYRVRNLQIDSVFELLGPYARSVDAVDSAGSYVSFTNLNRVIDNVLLIRDTVENTAAMLKLLEKFDRPAPQVQISVWVLRGGSAGATGTIPADLTKNLELLIPDLGFALDARGLLRSAIGPDLDLRLSLSGESGDSFTLSLYTGPYDDQSGSLALNECSLTRTSAATGHEEELFKTTTSVRAGEYAVIGVTGSEPVLLALRLQALP